MNALMAKGGGGRSEDGLRSIFETFGWNVVVPRGKQTSPQPDLAPLSQNVLSLPEARFCLPPLLSLSVSLIVPSSLRSCAFPSTHISYAKTGKQHVTDGASSPRQKKKVRVSAKIHILPSPVTLKNSSVCRPPDPLAAKAEACCGAAGLSCNHDPVQMFWSIGETTFSRCFVEDILSECDTVQS